MHKKMKKIQDGRMPVSEQAVRVLGIENKRGG